MSKLDRMSYCKLYKGESQNPYDGDFGLIWDYEKYWVEHENPDTYSQMLGDYLIYGLRTFRDEDGVPATLKALIWSRYAHWYGANDTQGFKDWYSNVMDSIDNQ